MTGFAGLAAYFEMNQSSDKGGKVGKNDKGDSIQLIRQGKEAQPYIQNRRA